MGLQGLASSFSPKHIVYRPECPKVDLSVMPGISRHTFISTSLSARPIVAFALRPGPRRFQPLFKSMLVLIGPFTTTMAAEAPAVSASADALNSGSNNARIAATTTGAYSGRHPAHHGIYSHLVCGDPPVPAGPSSQHLPRPHPRCLHKPLYRL